MTEKELLVITLEKPANNWNYIYTLFYCLSPFIAIRNIHF